MIAQTAVDAVLDQADDDKQGSAATALADLLDNLGAWGWTDDYDHVPSDRLAIVESSGVWWVVYRGTEPDQAWRFADREAACAKLDDLLITSEAAPMTRLTGRLVERAS